MTSSQHKLLHQDFFYHNLIPYMSLIDVVEHRFLCKLFYRVSLTTLQKWSKYWHLGGLPDREVYQELTRWEKERGIKVPDDIKCFYASWRGTEPLFQRLLTVFSPTTATRGRIRELFLYNDEFLSTYTFDGYVCLASTLMPSVHKDFDISLLTYLDLNGTYTGVKNSIFDVEYVDRYIDPNFREEILSSLDREKIGQVMYQGHGYSSYGMGMTARNFFELLDMMPENRFYYHEEAAVQPVYWMRGSGHKSFQDAPEKRLVFSEGMLDSPF